MKYKELYVYTEQSTKYEISTFGNCRRNGKVLKPLQTKSGHLQVDIEGERYYLHRLVVSNFIQTIPSSLEVHHINKKPDINYLNNLELLERQAHRQKHLRVVK